MKMIFLNDEMSLVLLKRDFYNMGIQNVPWILSHQRNLSTSGISFYFTVMPKSDVSLYKLCRLK